MELPTGTVTFLFTDIEGSARLWDEHPEEMRTALARHEALLHEATAAHEGYVFKTVGDAFCVAFGRATDALAAALDGQRALQAEPWGAVGALKVRMALHTGEAQERGGDYFGPPLNRCSRLLNAGHGGQVLLSRTAAQLVCEALPAQAALKPLGEHRLRDLTQPEDIFQLGHPDLPCDFPPLRSLAAFSHNLPLQLTSLIGREQELQELQRLLGTTRLLTLTGTAGAGKTRLALQLGADLLEDYPDGVWLTELAALTVPSLVPQAGLGALGLREEPGRTLTDTLTDSLRPKRALLILDNCEHLVEACARLAETLLRSCPEVRLLATSREALRAEGETVWRVPSLTVPDREPARLPPPERLTQYGAVQLFIERAVAARPEFRVTNENAPAVAEICWRLDGIPLAIELAAVRINVLSAQDVEQRLGDRFRLLTGGRRTALARQQTLRAAVEWSYDLLSERERAFFDHLSVFAGGFTLDASQAVCTGDGIEEWEAVDLLGELVGKSLVVAEEGADGMRYRLLETLRAYGAQRLEAAGDAEATHRRHAEHFAGRATQMQAKAGGPEEATWLARFETEHANFRLALAWALRQEVGLGLRLANGLGRFWVLCGHWTEGREWLSRYLDAAAEVDPELRATALNWTSALASEQGDYASARRLLEEALGLHREVGNRRGEANALIGIGNAATNQDDYRAARSAYERSLTLWEELGASSGVVRCLHGLGWVAQEQGDAGSARAYYERCLALYREQGDKRSTATILNNMGDLALDEGDCAAALALCEESLALRRELGDRTGAGVSLYGLGGVAQRQGDYARARALCEEAVAILRKLGAGHPLAHAMLGVADAARGQGQHSEADAWYREALLVSADMGSKSLIIECIEGLATLACDQALMQRAVRLFGACDALRRSMGLPISSADPAVYEPQVNAARAALGDEASAAWAAGQAMTLDEAVAEALRDDPPEVQ